MYKNVYYDTQKSIIHLWEEKNKKNTYQKIPWTPYFFQKTDEDSDFKSIDNFTVKKIKSKSYKEYKSKEKASISIYENNVIPTLQFLSEKYYNISEDDIIPSKLKIYSIDIETHVGDGFPHAHLAEQQITEINIKEFGDKSYTWGLNKYTGDSDLIYTYCKNEPDLLKIFLNWFHRYAPDVLTGWNICAEKKMNSFGGFDIPYIINRCIKLFGDDTKIFNLLSPINILRKWNDKKSNAMYFDIAGITVIDYLSLYKWYTTKNQEKHTLDFIAKDELDENKLDYSEYGDLNTLEKENWNLYTDYNMKDNLLVERLENKLGYIKLIQNLAILTKTPLKSYNASAQQIEGIFLTYYRRNNLCAPFFAGGTQERFPAAFVKEPQKGLHPWVVDLDITSSYPTSIILLNISPETYIGKIQLSEKDVLTCCENKNFNIPFTFIKTTGIKKIKDKSLKLFNTMYNKKLITIAPCGSVFDNTKKGVFPILESNVFKKRKFIKEKMFVLKKELSIDDDKLKKEKSKQLFNYQWALKIILNQAYGITAIPYSRYFNTNVSEAITSTSKLTIKKGDMFANNLLNNISIDNNFKTLIENIKNEINKG